MPWPRSKARQRIAAKRTPCSLERGEPLCDGVPVRSSLFRGLPLRGKGEREGPITRSREQALDIAERVLAQVLADRSKWNSLVEAHSDDRFSRSQAGRTGVLDPAIMPEGFASFAYDQPVGSIHPKVVEAPFGFHIVWKVN